MIHGVINVLIIIIIIILQHASGSILSVNSSCRRPSLGNIYNRAFTATQFYREKSLTAVSSSSLHSWPEEGACMGVSAMGGNFVCCTIDQAIDQTGRISKPAVATILISRSHQAILQGAAMVKPEIVVSLSLPHYNIRKDTATATTAMYQ